MTRPYLDPRDHAFAHGPTFARPASAKAARDLFHRAEDGDLLMAVFDRFLSGAEVGEGLRLGLYSRLVAPSAGKVRIGRDCVIRGLIRCDGSGQVIVGDGVYIGDGVVVSAMTKIDIGDGALIAHGAQIFDNDTHPLDPAERQAHYRGILKLERAREVTIPTRLVRIGRRAWIGFNAAVMKGVAVGDEAIVAACAVVTTDVPPGATVAGNPARLVGRSAEAAPALSAPSGWLSRLLGR